MPPPPPAHSRSRSHLQPHPWPLSDLDWELTLGPPFPSRPHVLHGCSHPHLSFPVPPHPELQMHLQPLQEPFCSPPLAATHLTGARASAATHLPSSDLPRSIPEPSSPSSIRILPRMKQKSLVTADEQPLAWFKAELKRKKQSPERGKSAGSARGLYGTG